MIVDIPLVYILPNPWQTRQGEPDPEYISDLAADIKTNGLLQLPMGRVVAKDGSPLDDWSMTMSLSKTDMKAFEAKDGVRLQLAFGHNRLAAFRQLHVETCDDAWRAMPVRIKQASDEEMAQLAWSENERRRDVTPIERANAIQRRISDFGWTQQQAAERLGLARSTVANILRLLALPDDVRQALASGAITERTAMALADLMSLPKVLLDNAERPAYYAGDTEKPSKITGWALEGTYTSDQVRSAIRRICDKHGANLGDKEAPPLDLVVPIENVNSPTCRDCELRLAERNLCLDTKCYQRKQNYHNTLRLQKVSEEIGIPAAEEGQRLHSSSQYRTFTSWDTRDIDTADILATKCEHLRVGLGYADSKQIPEHPGFEIGCKRGAFCTCIRGIRALKAGEEKTEVEQLMETPAVEISPAPSAPETISDNGAAPDAKELAQIARDADRRRRAEMEAADSLRSYALPAIVSAIDADKPETWRRIAAAMGAGYRLEDDASLLDIKMEIAGKLLAKRGEYERDPEKYLDRLRSDLERMGLDPDNPWNGIDESPILQEQESTTVFPEL